MQVGRAGRVCWRVEWLPQAGSLGVNKPLFISFSADGAVFFIFAGAAEKLGTGKEPLW
jgi:hypothetical protein